MTTVQNLPQFTSIQFKTKDGENIVATKKDGVVTLVGDVNGVRQVPLEQFIKDLPNVGQSLERVPEKDEVVFQGKKDKQTLPTEYFQEYKVKAGKGKKVGVAIASAVVPGLGQVLNGDWGRGIAHWLGGIALSALTGFSLLVAEGGKKSGLVGVALGVAGVIANRAVAAVNAAKNATETVRVKKTL